MKSQDAAERALELYADTVRRICFLHLKNYHEAEDIFQDVFLQYLLYDGMFASAAHEKAWLIRVAINRCKNLLKSFYRRMVRALADSHSEPSYIQDGQREVLEAVLRLSEKYRQVIYLFYYEGYTAVEIADILGQNVNTVYTRLARAKAQLKEILGGEQLDG